MADTCQVNSNHNSANSDGILDEGIQPGLSRESLVVISGSYEDLTDCVLVESVNDNRVDNGDNPGRGREVVNRTISAVQGLEAKGVESSEDSSAEDGRPTRKLSNAEKLKRQSSAEEVEYVHSEEWRRNSKHIFVISSSGKPIYSRYGDEDRLVSLMGVMQALVAFVQDAEGNKMQCIVAGDHRFVFLVREHLTLVAVASTQETTQQLSIQLNYLYNQILSILTLSRINSVFRQRQNYDLRRLLTGSDRFFNNLLQLMDADPCFLLSAVKCLPLESSIREMIAQVISQQVKVKDIVFALLITDGQLVTIVRMKKYFIHAIDMHLIFNLINASESFKTAESWTPVCLPKFDPDGYLQAYVSYLDAACHTCLILLSVNRDSEVFHSLSSCRQAIQERLEKHACLRAIEASRQQGGYRVSDTDVPDLRHFLYKSRTASEFTSPVYGRPYDSPEEQQRLLSLYRYVHGQMHNPQQQPHRFLFHVGDYEALLGWISPSFELYAVFNPLITKTGAINAVNQLLKWMKREEDRLFILSSPTF